MSILDTIKDKIPFLKKEGEEDLSDDFGSDLGDLSDVPSPEAEPEPFSDEQFEPPADEYQQPEPEMAPEPQPEYQPPPQQQYQPPQPQYQPAPQFPEQAQPSHPDLENIKLTMDNIKQRIENIMHRFDTLASELDSIKSEAAYEKTVLSKYDYYLRDLTVKLDTLEKQHEAIWHEIKNTSQNP